MTTPHRAPGPHVPLPGSAAGPVGADGGHRTTPPVATINHTATSGPGLAALARPAASAVRHVPRRATGRPPVTAANAGPLRIRLFPVTVGALPTPA